MKDAALIISDLSITVFLLFIHTKMFEIKNKTLRNKIIMYFVCAICVIAYGIVAYVSPISPGIASLVCCLIPSFVLFISLSSYRDQRFIVTFCFLHSIAMIVGFFVRFAAFVGGEVGAVISCAAVLALQVLLYMVCRPYFSKYRNILDSVKHGWGTMTVSMIMAYFSLMFLSQYPAPIMQRPDAFPGYAVFALTIIAFFTMFVMTVVERGKLYKTNEQLLKEQGWHRVAYVDALTGVRNRMAYMEQINNLERVRTPEHIACVMMFDIDNFKNINDLLGHHAGDEMLKNIASAMKKVFVEDVYDIFRIGGDEFAVIALGAEKETVEQKLGELNSIIEENQIGSTVSYGYSFVNHQQNNAFEAAFIRADKQMYINKGEKYSQFK